MTPYPLGILQPRGLPSNGYPHADSGPLVFYPGSHRLPYVFSKAWAFQNPISRRTDIARIWSGMNRAFRI